MKTCHKLEFLCKCMLKLRLFDLTELKYQSSVISSFNNYFFNTKAKNKCFIVLKYISLGLQQSKALQHFKVNPVLTN